MEAQNIIGWLAAITGVSFSIPQLYKSYKTKSTGDLSWAMWILYTSSAVLWFLYGFFDKDWIIMTPNIIAFTSNITIMHLKYKYD